jgi:hypothetical protein
LVVGAGDAAVARYRRSPKTNCQDRRPTRQYGEGKDGTPFTRVRIGLAPIGNLEVLSVFALFEHSAATYGRHQFCSVPGPGTADPLAAAPKPDSCHKKDKHSCDCSQGNATHGTATLPDHKKAMSPQKWQQLSRYMSNLTRHVAPHEASINMSHCHQGMHRDRSRHQSTNRVSRHIAQGINRQSMSIDTSQNPKDVSKLASRHVALQGTSNLTLWTWLLAPLPNGVP